MIDTRSCICAIFMIKLYVYLLLKHQDTVTYKSKPSMQS